ncbi:MAG: ABC transporter permease [Cyclobacteriaceae bacterium]
MIHNYLRIALRNLYKNRLFSTLNILGLACGIACSLLILLWVNDELSFDQFHAKKDRLYKIRENQFYSDGNIFTFSSTPGPMAPFIKEKFPEIELATRVSWKVDNLLAFEDKALMEEGLYVDQDFIQMFTFRMLNGDAESVLMNPNSIVLTEKLALKYFGDVNPVGKMMIFNKEEALQVSGVIQDPPSNSSLEFDYLLPFQKFFEANKAWIDQWGNNNIRTNILLVDGSDADAFAEKLRFEIKEHVPDSNTELLIQPFTDDYLYGKWENGKLAGGRIEYVRIFFLVAIFILVIASINFMNLSTAQAGRRAKEVGLRKVVGAVPWQLLVQFIGESLLITFIASLIAVGAVKLLMPIYNDITGKTLGFFLLDSNTLLVFLFVVIGTGLAAGSYPAFYISKFQPSKVLKGQMRAGVSASKFRKALVVVQFSLSILLIICTSVVYRQMRFTQNRDIGFDRNDVFYLDMRDDMPQKFEVIRNQLLTDPSIESVTACSQLPIDIGNSTGSIVWAGKDPAEEILFSEISVDYSFVEAMKMEILDGRTFDRQMLSDSNNFVVNEVAAAKIGFGDQTVGQELTMWGDKKGQIIGVVKNFNFGSLHRKIEPLIIHIGSKRYTDRALIRAAEGRVAQAIQATEKIANQYNPGYPFQFEFLSKDWEEMYQSESRMGTIFNGFAGLSIFISCLGLFGLSAFSAEQRTKELGVRKVMGASVRGLVQLVAKDFVGLILVAAAIGCPLGWYFMDQWLGTYAFRVDVGFASLLFSTGLCLLVSMVTVGYHALRVSMTSPTESLRYE